MSYVGGNYRGRPLPVPDHPAGGLPHLLLRGQRRAGHRQAPFDRHVLGSFRGSTAHRSRPPPAGLGLGGGGGRGLCGRLETSQETRKDQTAGLTRGSFHFHYKLEYIYTPNFFGHLRRGKASSIRQKVP